ncbi:MAG: hypothetical protein ACK50C_06660 [Gemmatimonadaceae bacterium]
MTAPAVRLPASASALDQRLAREQGALQARSTAGAVLAAVAALAAVLALAALVLSAGRWMAWPRAVPFVAWALAGGGAVMVARWRRRRDAEVLTVPSLAGAIEREQQLRAGSLRGALEVAASGPLGARAAHDIALRLAPGVLAPQVAGRLRRDVAVSGVLATAAVAALVLTARLAPDGFAAMRHPVRAWQGTLLPALAFETVPASVPRGMPVTLRLIATGRSAVVVSRRAVGEAWQDTVLSVPASGMASLALGPVRALTMVRVSDGRAPELSASLVVEDRGWIGDVSLRALYPAYLARTDEALEAVPPLRVPRGTRVQVRVMLRGGARDALLTNGRDTVTLTNGEPMTGGAVAAVGLLPIDRDGTWRWHADATPRADGAVLPPELPDALPFTIIPDLAPDVEIVAPATDTAIGQAGVVPILIDASDDHGVARVQLSVWHEANGGDGRVPRERIDVAAPATPLFEGGATIALDGRGLEPGDKLHVTAIATDDSPWAQQATSAEIVLRVPTLAEQRSMARSLADSLAARAAQLAQQERRLQQNTSDASRSRELKSGNANEPQSGGAKSDGSKSQSMSFTAAEKAKQLAKDQQQLGAKVDSLRMSAKDLESRLKNANALDTALASRMRDIQKMLRDAMTPEMQKQLEALNKSTERLSGTEAQQSMQQLAEQQKQMREQLEKSAEMLKRAALEGAMQTLRDDAKELAKDQKQLADRLDGQKRDGTSGKPGEAREGGEPRPSQDPKALADRSRDLEREIQSLAKRLEEAGAKPGASRTREAQPLAKPAADAMTQAAKAAAREAQEPAQQPAQREAQQNAQREAQPGAQQQGKQDPRQQGSQSAQQGAPQQGQQGAQQQGQRGAQQQGQQGNQAGGQQGGQPQGPQGAPPQGGQGNPSEQARQAADAMDKAAQQLAQARDAQVDAWKGELSDQLDKSINETMQLARQQADLEKKMRQQGAQGAPGMQGEQSALQQGVQQAAERLEKAGRESSLLSQRSQKAMGEAQRRVSQATQAMQQSGQPGGSEQAQNAMKDATEALNQALSSLVRDRERVNGAQSASGFTEMMEQLKQLAQQQGQLNSQMQGLNLMPGGAKGDQAQQQARVLAKQQREVARTLTDVSDADQTGRTDALAKEAQQLAQQMERGGLDPNVAARQQALYRRLLDAGRFLEQDERDDQGPREAKAASGNGAAGRVDGPQSGKAGSRYAPPTWNDLRGLGPDERRLVIEYFRRLNGSTPPS